ncbi:MAG: DUF2244 domain-containing protein [bacterium]|nr:DUF2244 domain-containing protein [bacterium]
MLILYHAFKANDRGTDIYETVELTPNHLSIIPCVENNANGASILIG